ncbi:hypothetical protein TNCV_2271801 [Trichonephila clavipes]|nr:hypothetical protein TNCV_2271801 [Trichonephila clavipes]
MINYSRTLEQMALTPTNRSQDVGKNSLDHIAKRTKWVNFKNRHMPLSWSMSPGKPNKNRFIASTDYSNQSSTRMVSFKPLVYGASLKEELMSCMTRVAISEGKKGSHHALNPYGCPLGPDHMQFHFRRHSHAMVPTEKRF